MAIGNKNAKVYTLYTSSSYTYYNKSPLYVLQKKIIIVILVFIYDFNKSNCSFFALILSRVVVLAKVLNCIHGDKTSKYVSTWFTFIMGQEKLCGVCLFPEYTFFFPVETLAKLFFINKMQYFPRVV